MGDYALSNESDSRKSQYQHKKSHYSAQYGMRGYVLDPVHSGVVPVSDSLYLSYDLTDDLPADFLGHWLQMAYLCLFHFCYEIA